MCFWAGSVGVRQTVGARVSLLQPGWCARALVRWANSPRWLICYKDDHSQNTSFEQNWLDVISVSHLLSVRFAACLSILTSVLTHSALCICPTPFRMCVLFTTSLFSCFLLFFFSLLLEVYTTWYCILTGLHFLSLTVSCGRGWRSFRRNC